MKCFVCGLLGFVMAALLAAAAFFAYKVYCPDARLPGEPERSVKCQCGE